MSELNNEKKCEYCGKPFNGRKSIQRFCKTTCRTAWHRKKNQEKMKMITRACDWCGRPMKIREDSRRIFCRPACAAMKYRDEKKKALRINELIVGAIVRRTGRKPENLSMKVDPITQRY